MWGTVLKGHCIRKAENHCSRGMTENLGGLRRNNHCTSSVVWHFQFVDSEAILACLVWQHTLGSQSASRDYKHFIFTWQSHWNNLLSYLLPRGKGGPMFSSIIEAIKISLNKVTKYIENLELEVFCDTSWNIMKACFSLGCWHVTCKAYFSALPVIWNVHKLITEFPSIT